jgi:hypothetical protein
VSTTCVATVVHDNWQVPQPLPPLEHLDLSSQFPAIKAQLQTRLAELVATAYQTGWCELDTALACGAIGLFVCSLPAFSLRERIVSGTYHDVLNCGVGKDGAAQCQDPVAVMHANSGFWGPFCQEG